MKLGPTSIFALSAVAFGVSQASAATAIGEYATFSGFGTTAVTITDTDDVEFVRFGQPSGATDEADFNVDSNLGLQLNAQPAQWLSGTVQLLTQHREEENMSSEVEWAFVGIEPVDGLRIRVGRTALPTFAISDTRNIGFANTWVRPPEEVYGLALLDRLEGADVSYRMPLGSSTLTLMAFAGDSEIKKIQGVTIDVKDVWGGSVNWEMDGVSLRASRTTGDSQLADIGVGYSGESAYTFTNLGVSVERGDVVARAEYATRRSEEFKEQAEASGWYVFGGYRFGSLLPYATYASTEPEHDYMPGYISGEQSTISAGVRWDAFSSASVKFQLDRVDPHDTHGISLVTPMIVTPFGAFASPYDDEVTVATLAVDFVF